jgi:hypothetical protein
MDLIRFTLPFFLVMALTPMDAASQPNVKSLAALVYNCLKTEQCDQLKTVGVGVDNKLFHEFTLYDDKMSIEYTILVEERRLEIRLRVDEYETTLVDSNLDGVVDHVIQISNKDGTVDIYGRSEMVRPAKEQRLYLEVLSIAVQALAIQQTARKK